MNLGLFCPGESRRGQRKLGDPAVLRRFPLLTIACLGYVHESITASCLSVTSGHVNRIKLVHLCLSLFIISWEESLGKMTAERMKNGQHSGMFF